MDNGQWTMDNGQWTMQNGQWLTPVTRPIGVNLTSIPPRFHPLPNPFPIQGAGLPAPLPPCGLCWESPGRASRKGAKTQRSGQKMVFTNRVLVGEGAGGRGADVEIKRHPYAAIPPNGKVRAGPRAKAQRRKGPGRRWCLPTESLWGRGKGGQTWR
jgi:hypothetical protein